MDQRRNRLRTALAGAVLALGFLIVGAPASAAEADGDEDGVQDVFDNCPTVPNPDQSDVDGDLIGDVCDLEPDPRLDSDGDGVPDDGDNCQSTYNPDQSDQDVDGSGDACDPTDTDGDGLADVVDNCPQNPNADQSDRDGDGQGDACEDARGDDDHDGIDDGFDNCPSVPNPDQADGDGNGTGAACDVVEWDSDGDGVLDAQDNCAAESNADQADSDLDGIGDVCDPTPSPSATPTRTADCKRGGWRAHTTEDGRPFRNQGHCIRYVTEWDRAHRPGHHCGDSRDVPRGGRPAQPGREHARPRHR